MTFNGYFAVATQYDVSASGLGNPPKKLIVNAEDAEALVRIFLQNDVNEINIRRNPPFTEIQSQTLNLTGHGSDGEGQ